MSFNVNPNPTDVFHDTASFSFKTTPTTRHSYRVSEPEVDTTLCWPRRVAEGATLSAV
ncbi:hypothetical protein DPMN_126623 [Dreissena polymorpha]|uniref:Uncharacterized protein n=1 Tax=Dreissena polymorpha TaxID=45954 RepID=A0A9D4GXE2_DREPO|nr:hypothetical protein DPMN_126623 [Dreissena polymorpha]